MISINSLKRIAIGIRAIVKTAVILTVAILLILGILEISYKQTYSVSLNGDIIGYTNDKVALQKRINDYITSGNGQDVAFVEVDNLPTYTACLLKKNVQTNDDEIFNKVTSTGTTYYKYYAITVDNDEKANVTSFSDAEDTVNQLKEKGSANADSLGIIEKYDTAQVESTPVDDCVSTIYEKKTTKNAVSGYAKIAKTIDNSQTSVQTNIGITLIRPVSGIITSRFGVRSRDNHKGLDISAPKGTAIKAAASGTVISSGYSTAYSGYGNCIVVRSTSSVVIIYGHCSTVYVATGESVTQGQVIGAVGSTGISTGNHLHFEIRYNGSAIDPQNYVYN
jgi:murein DD-endopeptidase MepM/ murein hydrolase activator NlpD